MTSFRPTTCLPVSAAGGRRPYLLFRARVVGLREDAKDIALSLWCLSLGPLVYAASLATVAAMLAITSLVLVGSGRNTLPLIGRSIRHLAIFVALGFGPLILVIGHAFNNAAWRTRPAQAMIAGTAAAVSVGLISFGIWQEWFLSSLFIAGAFVVLAARQSARAARGTISCEMGLRQID